MIHLLISTYKRDNSNLRIKIPSLNHFSLDSQLHKVSKYLYFKSYLYSKYNLMPHVITDNSMFKLLMGKCVRHLL